MRQRGSIACDGCGEMVAPIGDERPITAAARLGWDWFTGRLDATHHWCPTCQTTPTYRAVAAEAGIRVESGND